MNPLLAIGAAIMAYHVVSCAWHIGRAYAKYKNEPALGTEREMDDWE